MFDKKEFLGEFFRLFELKILSKIELLLLVDICDDLCTAYPQFGQPFLNSSLKPVFPHLGHLTDAKNFPQVGQNFEFAGTSEPQLSQKNFAFLESFFRILNLVKQYSFHQ